MLNEKLNEKQKELLYTDYAPNKCVEYKRIYELLLNKKPSSCNCNCSTIFRIIKEELKKQDMPKPKLQAKSRLKNDKGQFTIKKAQEIITNSDLIQQVQQELLAGYQDIDKIKRAFNTIRPDELANMRLMKSVIMNWKN